MKYITIEQIQNFHIKLINATGGSHGLKDKNLLDSAINSPLATFDGVDLYPGIIDKAAKLAYSLVNNHCFVDGNKRIGLYAMLIFLETNEIKLKFDKQELISLGLGLADGSITEYQLKDWIISHKNN